jgi:diacylglycerol kinase (ATP)
MSRPIVVIRNPVSGRARSDRKWEIAREALRDHHVEVLTTTAPGDAVTLARAHAAPGQLIIAAGGDGTVGAVAAGLLGTGAILGALPLGTGNDLCRTLGYGPDVRKALDAILHGTESLMDAGRWEVAGACGTFVNIAGCGFDACVADRVNHGHRLLRGTTAYVAAVLETLATFHPARVRLTVDEQVFETDATLIAIANARTYGGGMAVAPDAKIDDGLLDVIVVRGVGRLEFLRAFPSVFKGKHLAHPKVLSLRGTSIRIQSETTLPILADGEIVGGTDARFEVLPAALRVMLPRRS